MKNFLSELIKKDIRIDLVEGELSVKFPKNGIDKILLEEIKVRKEAIKEYLNNLTEGEFVVIPALASAEHYAISNSQHRLWILSQFEGSSVAYTISGRTYLNQDIDIECFKRAIDSTIERHEILRTVFKADETGEIRQWILKKEDLGFKIDYKDFRKEQDKEESIKKYVAEDAYKPFDLVKGPLLRASLLQVEDEAYVFYYNMHHIVGDGWSMEVLSKDVFSYYEAHKDNKEPWLKPLRIQYKDYSAWQLARIEEEAFKIHKAYWLDQLRGELPLLDLPGTKPRPRIKTYNGHGLNAYINSETTGKLRKYSQENGGSLFMGLLAAWNILMYRYTSQTDIIIGTPMAGREHADLEDQIGFYLNTLALRNEIKPGESFNDFYRELKNNTLKSYSHGMYPFDTLLEELDLQKDTSRSAVFDVLIALQNSGETGEGRKLNKEELSRISDQGPTTSTFDIRISIQEVGDYLSLHFVYNPDVYDKEMIEGLINHYRQLLQALLENPETRISQIDYLSETEKHELLFTFNNTLADYPKDKTLVELFEAQAAKTPDQVAVVFGGTELTYRELNEQSNRLARHLKENCGITTEDLVGIQLHKSDWLIISILGTLKAGAAYVPIDPDYPSSRKEYIVKDTSLKLLITEANFIHEIDYYEGQVFAIDVEFDPGKYSSERLPIATGPDNLAYVIYTSGSTGHPKGILVEHKSVVNICFFYDLKASRSALTCNYVFDVSVLEIFATLLSGGSLYIPEQTIVFSVEHYSKFLTDNKINHAYIHPFQVMEMSNVLKGYDRHYLKRILIGVDKIEVDKIEWYKENNIQILNGYGPSECTVCCSMMTVQDPKAISTKFIPIGKPISNTGIYILDQENQLRPKGAIGEICVGGDGLARGYLNQEALTKEKFIENPFEKGTRLYKTGDLGKWLPDGNIEFIGRKDDQVKVRGYRIELGEIEHALQSHEAIETAVVLVKKNKEEEKELVAYFTAKTEQNTNELNSYLKELLPEYMLPVYYIQLEALPLTAGGKIDKKSLPDPEVLGLAGRTEYVAPRNEIEEKLVKIWEEVLKRENIGVKDDFFALGGHSLKIIKVINQINKQFDLKYDLKGVYTEPTIESMAQKIKTDIWFTESKVENESDYNEVKI